MKLGKSANNDCSAFLIFVVSVALVMSASLTIIGCANGKRAEAKSLLEQSFKAAEARNNQEALRLANKAIETDDTFADAHLWRAGMYGGVAIAEKENQDLANTYFSRAIEDYKTVIRLKPNDLRALDAMLQLSSIFILRKQYDDAVHWSQEALKLDPSNERAKENIERIEILKTKGQ